VSGPLTDRSIDKAKAVAQFDKLCEALSNVGLQTEVRNGDAHSVLLFVRVASDEHLHGEVYRSRYLLPRMPHAFSS
jgi:anoctamin-10